MRTTHLDRLFTLLATAFVSALCGGGNAMAQRFQAVYGSPRCVEAGRAGVAQLRAGGYIACGETFLDVDGGCQDVNSHIYVIRTNPDGSRIWSFVYELGERDSATDIIECLDSTLVVCGVVKDAVGCNTGRDAFLMRLDVANGNVLNARTYGLKESDEIAWNLVEATRGNGPINNTRPTDLIVVGSTTWQAGYDAAGNPARDAYIFRTDANLKLIWDRHYGGPESHDDYLYGVDEARLDVPDDKTADIVATGGTNTWGAGGYDIFNLRVSGDDGSIGAAPQNAATYGLKYDEEGRAIIELQKFTNPGNLVVAGITWSRPAPSTNQEVAMLQTEADPCKWVADQYAGDNADGPDGGMDLKEDVFPSVDVGDVIVTGFTDFGEDDAGNIAPINAFLQKFECGTLHLVNNAMAYGGVDDDWGWSVNNATRVNDKTKETEGYVVAGFNQSSNLIGNDPQQLYLFKTDLALDAGDCYQQEFKFDAEDIKFKQDCPKVYNQPFGKDCTPKWRKWEIFNWYWLCYFYPRAQERQGGNDGVSGVETPTTLTFDEGAVQCYPNPVAHGTSLNLRFDMKASVQAEVAMTDIVGRIVYHERTDVTGGSELLSIPTTALPAGAYVVRVTIGEHSSTMHVVVSH